MQYAKSARSKCKKCKEPIAKDEMRLQVNVPAESNSAGFSMSSNYHVGCFKIPRKFSTGAEKMDPADFVREYIEDGTNDQSILPEKLDEIIELIEKANMPTTAATSSATKRKKSESSSKGKDDSLMGRIKQAAMAKAEQEDDEEEEPPAKKKVKSSSRKQTKSSKIKQEEDDDDKEEDEPIDEEEETKQMAEYYLEHHKKKLDDLKDYLRYVVNWLFCQWTQLFRMFLGSYSEFLFISWNRQNLMGVKEFVLFKVIDGMTHGRLGYCPICGGRLKFPDGVYDQVVCMGRFDEDSQMRIPCDFVGKRTDRKNRLLPFYLEEPTEEEKEEMTKLQEEARGEGEVSESPAAKELLEAADKCKWEVDTPAGLQQTAAELVAIVKDKVDLPEGRDPKRLVGQILVSNKDKGAKGVLEEIIAKYGFKEDKEAKKEAKQAVMEAACENPKNAALLLAMQELATLYFKGKYDGTFSQV